MTTPNDLLSPQSDASKSKNNRGKGFSPTEDLLIAKAWIAAFDDPSRGDNKKKSLKEKIAEHYVSMAKEGIATGIYDSSAVNPHRSLLALSHRYDVIRRTALLVKECYDQHPKGLNEDDAMWKQRIHPHIVDSITDVKRLVISPKKISAFLPVVDYVVETREELLGNQEPVERIHREHHHAPIGALPASAATTVAASPMVAMAAALGGSPFLKRKADDAGSDEATDDDSPLLGGLRKVRKGSLVPESLSTAVPSLSAGGAESLMGSADPLNIDAVFAQYQSETTQNLQAVQVQLAERAKFEKEMTNKYAKHDRQQAYNHAKFMHAFSLMSTLPEADRQSAAQSLLASIGKKAPSSAAKAMTTPTVRAMASRTANMSNPASSTNLDAENSMNSIFHNLATQGSDTPLI